MTSAATPSVPTTILGQPHQAKPRKIEIKLPPYTKHRYDLVYISIFPYLTCKHLLSSASNPSTLFKREVVSSQFVNYIGLTKLGAERPSQPSNLPTLIHLHQLDPHLYLSTHFTMSTIQNLKNFIRHGKQARQAAEPTTNLSPVNAQQQRYAPPPPQAQYAVSDPNVLDHKPLQHGNVPGGDFSAANIDSRNVAAQAGGAAAKAAGDNQRIGDAGSVDRSNDPSVLERIVAEERESQGKLPKYPGLERWTLLEKMGDGAFSNVYRARDNTGRAGEVAIKVVRKFEMNSTQVCAYVPQNLGFPFLCRCMLLLRFVFHLHKTPTSRQSLTNIIVH